MLDINRLLIVVIATTISVSVDGNLDINMHTGVQTCLKNCILKIALQKYVTNFSILIVLCNSKGNRILSN